MDINWIKGKKYGSFNWIDATGHVNASVGGEITGICANEFFVKENDGESKCAPFREVMERLDKSVKGYDGDTSLLEWKRLYYSRKADNIERMLEVINSNK